MIIVPSSARVSQSAYLEVVQAVLIHGIHFAKLGDGKVQQGATDSKWLVALPAFFDLSLRVLAVGETLTDRLAHGLGFAESNDESLR